MPSKLNPYLGFKDKAREAMEFYKSVFGGTLTLSTFQEFHAHQNPNDANKIMHSQLETENGITLMASDAPEGMEDTAGGSYSILLSGDNEAELRGYWEKLVVGGTITMPIEKAPRGDTFGMVTDQFGVPWMVNIAGQKA